jgi:amino acid efflux transporter
MGTMNVYVGGASKLAAALAREGGLPAWLGEDAGRSVPRRPLVVIGGVGVALLVALLLGFSSADGLIRATAACFIAVYVAATASAIRILTGRARVAALSAFVLVLVVAAFSEWYLLLPIGSAAAFAALHSHAQRGRKLDEAAGAVDQGHLLERPAVCVEQPG